MKTFNTYFTTESDLKNFIDVNGIQGSKALLVQLFSSKCEEEYIHSLTRLISSIVPKAVIIGSTTDGLIKDGSVSTKSVVLSFTQFENTSLKAFITDDFEEYFDAGVIVAKELIEPTTKVIISFIDGLGGNGEEYLNGISAMNKDVLVAGGLASDNAKFEKTLIYTKDKVLSRGVVAVALNSDKLHVYNDYAFNWLPIGLELKVTQCKKNRLYKIGNKTAIDAYRYYLGDEIADKLPAIGVEFPLIIKRDGVHISRAVLAKKDDGSLIFAGNFRKGDIIQFAYGDSSSIINASKTAIDKMVGVPVESIFLYSCMARRRFMPDRIEYETLPFNAIAPTSGFFTYGEFYTHTTRELFNETLTILALSESDTVQPFKEQKLLQDKSIKDDTIKALSHIARVTSIDIQRKNRKQTKIYRKLHAIGKSLNEKAEIDYLYNIACDFTTNDLNFEKCIIFEHDERNGWFKVAKSVGYESPKQKSVLSIINLLLSGKVIESLRINKEPIVHTADFPNESVDSLLKSLFLHEAYLELFGGNSDIPLGLIIVGNSSEHRSEHTRIAVDDMEMLALGNFTVELSNTINNIVYYKALIKEKQTLKESVLKRTREINKQKETFEAIYKTAKDGLAILDAETTAFLDANQAYVEMTGFTKEDLLRTSCRNLSVEADKIRSKKAIEEVIEKGFKKNFIKTCMVKDGRKVIVNMSISLMSDRKRLLVSAKDITKDKELEHQMQLMHKYTKDSIEYAALIQHSILSPDEELSTHFNDFFTIWKPKDVVGGDIYFFQEFNEDEIVVMVIDCTGHGVHGAFVTMLVKGIERQIVSEIFYQQESIDTAAILQKFNERMKKLLKQDECKKAASNAGFDGGVLYYNKKEKIIKYSGAEIPLFIIRNGEGHVLKGDKHSIGYIKSDANYKFKEYVVDVSKGANIYLSSDGYLDQIGGKKRFMFGKRRFQKLLESHYDQSFEKQKKILEDTFNDYSQNEERKDDLTIVGLQV